MAMALVCVSHQLLNDLQDTSKMEICNMHSAQPHVLFIYIISIELIYYYAYALVIYFNIAILIYLFINL